MKKELIDYFKKLNLTESEANLYFTLLESGQLNARTLAQKLGIKRTTTYNYIDHLMDRGFIVKTVSGSHPLFVANPPEEILPFVLDQKSEEVKGMQTLLPHIINEMETLLPVKAQSASDADIKFYKGIINARKIYQEALQAKEVRSYIRIDKEEPLFPSNASVFAEAFKKNKNLKIWEIIYDVDSATPSKESRSQKDRYFYKYMPKSKKLSSEDILLYDEKVAIVNFRGGRTNIVLHSPDLFNNMKEIFDFLWEMLPEPKG